MTPEMIDQIVMYLSTIFPAAASVGALIPLVMWVVGKINGLAEKIKGDNFQKDLAEREKNAAEREKELIEANKRLIIENANLQRKIDLMLDKMTGVKDYADHIDKEV